jgi:secreted PhoX family phosphatase
MHDDDIVEIEDIGSNPAPGRRFEDVAAARFGRRAALGGAAALAATAAEAQVPRTGGPSTLTFQEIPHGLAQTDSVAEGHEVQVVIRWGDAVLADAPAFDPARQTPDAQARQFGQNNDFLAFLPLPRGSNGADHGLLWVNHEYCSTGSMFPGLPAGNSAIRAAKTELQARTEMMAHGGSVVEIRRQDGKWAPVAGGTMNRRITAATPMRLSGPAAGHERMKTSADPNGTQVLGMLNNCAGGTTPWGTVLTCEENFNTYFGGEAARSGAQAAAYRRYGIQPASPNAWERFEPRFNLDREPNEPNRFGWVVEIDPFDPNSTPIKRTALGRFKHEGCTQAMAPDGRVVFYMGDDEMNDYVYRFVTARPFDRANPAANRDLLDEGTLSVARLEDDGKLVWMPLVFGEGPLTPANNFASQADVLIETRRAADLLGATPMDRPEDVEANPVNGRVYVMLTNNSRRAADRLNAANPRARNIHGHVVEIIPPGAGTPRVDHAAPEARWEMFLMAGKPGIDAGARYHRATSENGWLSCPDNCTFDSKGRIWIATDGAPTAAGVADAVYAADTMGPGRALTRLFYQTVAGAEICGPCFTPDDTTLFLAIQHPAEGSTYENPSTRWPDFDPALPARSSVIAIVKKGGGTVGS